MTKDRFPRGKTAIVGASTYGMGESPGLSSMDLAVNASVRALDQVGLTPGDVDGLFIGLPDDFLSGLTFAEYLGIQPRITENNRTGGSAFLTHAMWAALAIDPTTWCSSISKKARVSCAVSRASNPRPCASA